MFLQKALGPLAVCCALLLSGRVASAQNKVAVVNLQKAVFDTAEIKKADLEMQAKYKPRQDRLQQLQEEIAHLAQQLQTGQGKLTPQAESDLQAQGQTLQKQAQRVQEDLQQDVQSDRNDILSRTTQKMTAVIHKLAEDRGLDMVVDSSGMLYFKAALEITADATAAYDKAYPVAAASK